MDLEIIDRPIRFRLHGLSSSVENHRYGEVGCRLMDQMWPLVKQAQLKTTGINHWVYFADDQMFVGVDVSDGQQATIPEPLQPCECELPRYARHVHVGPYHELLQKWQALKAELTARGETMTVPSLEVYGHACEDEGSQPETTILIQLKPRVA
jgi:hypothetical protein